MEQGCSRDQWVWGWGEAEGCWEDSTWLAHKKVVCCVPCLHTWLFTSSFLPPLFSSFPSFSPPFFSHLFSPLLSPFFSFLSLSLSFSPFLPFPFTQRCLHFFGNRYPWSATTAATTKHPPAGHPSSTHVECGESSWCIF